MSSRSEFVGIRGLRYHVRRWGAADAPLLLAVHGWMDVSATFDRVARRLLPQFQVLMPDWRGFGHTEWPQDGYWFPDYVADLDALVDHCSPDAPVRLAGHSMGAQVASLYAGLRPSRVAKLAILDGLFLPDSDVRNTPRSYARWLDRLSAPAEAPAYRSFEELAARVRKRNPRLDPDHAAEIARAWAGEGPDGLIRLRCDPKHLLDMPRPYRQDESDAIWAQVGAETLFVDGAESAFARSVPPAEVARRRALFRDHRQATLDGAGHMLHFDAPEALADVLSAFFQA